MFIETKDKGYLLPLDKCVIKTKREESIGGIQAKVVAHIVGEFRVDTELVYEAKRAPNKEHPCYNCTESVCWDCDGYSYGVPEHIYDDKESPMLRYKIHQGKKYPLAEFTLSLEFDWRESNDVKRKLIRRKSEKERAIFITMMHDQINCSVVSGGASGIAKIPSISKTIVITPDESEMEETVDALNLSSRTKNLLAQNDIVTLDEFREADLSVLSKRRGFGEKVLKDIENELERVRE